MEAKEPIHNGREGGRQSGTRWRLAGVAPLLTSWSGLFDVYLQAGCDAKATN